MIPRQGVIAALPNAQKQTQGGCRNEETRKRGPSEKLHQNSRKRTKQNGDKQSDADFKALVIRMLKELIGYFNSIKKTQAEMKVTF